MLGGILALTARRRLEAIERDAIVARPLAQTAGFALLDWIPVTGYCYYAYRDWMWSYLLDPATISPAWGLYAGSAYFLAALVGAFVPQTLIQRGRFGLACAFTVACAALLAATWALTWDAYQFAGTYAEFHASPRPDRPWPADPAFQRTIDTCGPIIGLPFAALIAWNLIDGRRAAAAGNLQRPRQ